MKLRPFCLFLCLAILLTAAPAFAEQPWTEVRSPHFRVLTDGSPSDARHVAREFEQMRYVFATEFPKFRLESGAPLTIFLARDAQTEKKLDPGDWRHISGLASLIAASHLGWERQYISIRSSFPGNVLHFSIDADYKYSIAKHYPAYSMYTRSILDLNSHWLPAWLYSGLTQFYAYTRIEGNNIYLGSPDPLSRPLYDPPIPVETLISDWQKIPEYSNSTMRPLFSAESWALVHYLMLSPEMGRGAKFNRFLYLVQTGTPQKQAFEQAFGSFATIDKILGPYMRRYSFDSELMSNAPKFDERSYTVKKLSLAQTYAELAAYHLWTQDAKGAQPLVAKALQSDPHSGFAHEIQGYLYFRHGNDSAAAAEFTQAFALDPTLYLSLFAKTMLSPAASLKTAEDETAFHDAMLQVADINLQFAPAFIQLARLYMRQGDLPRAFSLSRRAEELEPGRAGYHVLTGKILLRMGKYAEAAEFAAYVAQRWHGQDREEAVALWNQIPARGRPAGVTITSNTPPNTQEIEGILESVNCGDTDKNGQHRHLNLTLLRDGHPHTFIAHEKFQFSYSDTFWWARDHANICHNLNGLRAIVRYSPSTTPNYAGSIVELRVFDDLPKADAVTPTKAATTGKQ